MHLLTTDLPTSGTGGYYRIDTDRRLRIEEYQGQVGLMDLKGMIASMVSDPCWSPDFHGLVDFSAAELDLSANDVLRLALVMRYEGNRSRGWLVFVTTNSTAYGTVRMLGYWSRNTDRMRIFNDRHEAENWLERHANQAPPDFRERDGFHEAATLRCVI